MKLKQIIVVVALCFWTLPAFAQNHATEVLTIKTALQQQGMDLSGNCGAFRITQRVAWALRDEGAGLVAKPNEPQCQGYAPDLVLYLDGKAFTTLVDPGLNNWPTWKQIDFIDPSRYRAPLDPGGGIVVPPPPPIPTPTVTTSTTMPMEVFAKLTTLELAQAQLAAREEQRDQQQRAAEQSEHTAIVTQITTAETNITKAINEPSWFTKVWENRGVQLAIVAAGTLLTTLAVKSTPKEQ